MKNVLFFSLVFMSISGLKAGAAKVEGFPRRPIFEWSYEDVVLRPDGPPRSAILSSRPYYTLRLTTAMEKEFKASREFQESVKKLAQYKLDEDIGEIKSDEYNNLNRKLQTVKQKMDKQHEEVTKMKYQQDLARLPHTNMAKYRPAYFAYRQTLKEYKALKEEKKQLVAKLQPDSYLVNRGRPAGHVISRGQARIRSKWLQARRQLKPARTRYEYSRRKAIIAKYKYGEGSPEHKTAVENEQKAYNIYQAAKLHHNEVQQQAMDSKWRKGRDQALGASNDLKKKLAKAKADLEKYIKMHKDEKVETTIKHVAYCEYMDAPDISLHPPGWVGECMAHMQCLDGKANIWYYGHAHCPTKPNGRCSPAKNCNIFDASSWKLAKDAKSPAKNPQYDYEEAEEAYEAEAGSAVQ